MPVQTVRCKPHGNRFTVQEHTLGGNMPEMLNEALQCDITWTDHVWVISDGFPRQITVMFTPGQAFMAANEEHQRDMLTEMIQRTLRFIAWDPDKTEVLFEDF